MMTFYGDNVRWWIGIVVNVLDPLQLGRAQVRIFGIHSRDNLQIPTGALPWATVLQPNIGGTSGIGFTPQLIPGSQVFGIFLDGKSSQAPCVLGAMPKIEVPSEQQLNSAQWNQGSQGQEAGQSPGGRTDGAVEIVNNLPVLGSNQERITQAYEYFRNQGYSREQAAGIVGNLMVESRYQNQELNINAINRNDQGPGQHSRGLAQWGPGRRRIYEQWSGKSWNQATFEDQLGFVVHELNNADSESGNLNVNANSNLKQASSVDLAATIFDTQYERSAGLHTNQRIQEGYRVLQIVEGS